MPAGDDRSSNANDSLGKRERFSTARPSGPAANSLLRIRHVFTILWDVKRFRIIAVSGEGSRERARNEEAEFAQRDAEAVYNLEVWMLALMSCMSGCG